ncbi:MAG TPA: hypothetical protein VHN14_18045 [Kofleriaceae bacterium]|jgi:hypothetical protein|nr:hypothetical protein [Kofleriaceae bacterium]
MVRFVVLALCSAACSRSQGATDRDLPGLVVESRKADPPIDVERATQDPAELGRALARPYRVLLAALGPHRVAVNSTTTVEEAGKQVSELSDHAQIENGDDGAYHALYTNSADYGRETIFVDGKLYLRPRYQRWHARSPETPDEPATLRDQYANAIAAAWDLLAPGAELTDQGPINFAGRTGHKISVRRSSEPSEPPTERITQRRWREHRTVDAVSGEVVLDTDKAVPLAVTLAGTIGFTRDGRRFAMKISVDSTLSGLGSENLITPPPDAEIVATPERLREVDDRDYLLQGIAPPLRRNLDGTAVPPAPLVKSGGPRSPDKAPENAADKPPDKGPDKKVDPSNHRKPQSGDAPAKRTPRPRHDDGATP